MLFLLSTANAYSDVKVEYIAHACFIVESPSGKRILIDPYKGHVWVGYSFPENIAVDAILISHPHYDHDAGGFMGYPFPWGPNVPVFRDPGDYEIDDIRVRGIKGKHADPYGKEFGQKNTIWRIDVGGVRIVHLGDNGPLTASNVQILTKVDVLMIPIDSQYHILKDAEIEAIREALTPHVLIPMHYRIPSLIVVQTSARGLGPIEPWLAERKSVVTLKRNEHTFSSESLRGKPRIVVFAPSEGIQPTTDEVLEKIRRQRKDEILEKIRRQQKIEAHEITVLEIASTPEGNPRVQLRLETTRGIRSFWYETGHKFEEWTVLEINPDIGCCKLRDGETGATHTICISES